MKVWYFSETAYPHLPSEETYDSIRVTLPNRFYDPTIGADLFDRYLDEWTLADEEGLNVMINEHHQTATCVDPAAPVLMAAIARMTKRARLLILGNPISNRRDPIRVAEEMALLDILSRGRLEVGFVRGVPYEIAAANANPVRSNERQWEALDLIVKAWTQHDGPFSHEGRFFQHRNVNIWPRPFQQPHPPIWVSATSASGAMKVGTRGYVNATFLTGFKNTPGVFDAYRRGWRESGRPGEVPLDRLAYSPMLFTADSEARARRGAEELLWYLRSNKVPDHYRNPPGYLPVEASVRVMRGAHSQLATSAKTMEVDVDSAIAAGIMFAGTPTQVHDQIVTFYDRVGGFGHMLMLGQAGFLSHDETVHGIKMFAREVLPKLQATLSSRSASRDAA